jgi:hypothetical protein
MPSFGCGRAPSRALHSPASTGQARIGVVVLLAASFAACFDSRRIIFREADRPDAGGAGGAPPVPQSQSAGVEPAAVLPGNERAAAPGILEATPLGAGDSVPLDAGLATGALDAGAPDAAP